MGLRVEANIAPAQLACDEQSQAMLGCRKISLLPKKQVESSFNLLRLLLFFVKKIFEALGMTQIAKRLEPSRVKKLQVKDSLQTQEIKLAKASGADKQELQESKPQVEAPMILPTEEHVAVPALVKVEESSDQNLPVDMASVEKTLDVLKEVSEKHLPEESKEKVKSYLASLVNYLSESSFNKNHPALAGKIVGFTMGLAMSFVLREVQTQGVMTTYKLANELKTYQYGFLPLMGATILAAGRSISNNTDNVNRFQRWVNQWINPGGEPIASKPLASLWAGFSILANPIGLAANEIGCFARQFSQQFSLSAVDLVAKEAESEDSSLSQESKDNIQGTHQAFIQGLSLGMMGFTFIQQGRLALSLLALLPSVVTVAVKYAGIALSSPYFLPVAGSAAGAAATVVLACQFFKHLLHKKIQKMTVSA